MTAEAEFDTRSGTEALAMLPELTDVYRAVRSQEPDGDDPLFSRSAFISRTQKQAQNPGFVLITVRVAGGLVGFSFGFPFGTGWWAECTLPPGRVMVATKFAVIELNVLPEFRGQGLGRELLNRLLSDRPEAFATLATLPSSMARTMYERWGWYKVAEFTNEPLMDALAFELRGPEHDTADS